MIDHKLVQTQLGQSSIYVRLCDHRSISLKIPNDTSLSLRHRPEYNRKADIHDVYRGQAQGGISTLKGQPFVFIFTSNAGVQHGYHDEFRDNGQFWYTGEGQEGDMKMVSGNKAIRDHEKEGKTIHLFEYTRKAHVKYLGKATYVDHHEELRPDKHGDMRLVYIFHLDIDAIPEEEQTDASTKELIGSDIKHLSKKPLDELREASLIRASKAKEPQERSRLVYYRSQALKAYVLRRANGICEGCGNPAPFKTPQGPYLECHHIHRLTDGGPDHPDNVVGLCPNCHRRAHSSCDKKSYNEYLTLVSKTN